MITFEHTAGHLATENDMKMEKGSTGHFSLDARYIRRMDDILGVLANEVFLSDNDNLNPTPIAKGRVQVVDRVPIAASGGLQDRALIDCLRPFLMKKPSDDDQQQSSWASQNADAMLHPRAPHRWMQDALKVPASQPRAASRKRQRVQTSGDASDTSGSTIKSTSNKRPSKRAASSSSMLKIRAHQIEQWSERYRELVQFQRVHGHCVVPYHYKDNIPLALWVKRQRHQHKLKREGNHSTMTDDRQQALDLLGFVWDSHKATWQERLNELIDFRKIHGHCNVPSKFEENPQLAIWVKCQRRQHRLLCDGVRSNITIERIQKLSSEGFVWNPRKTK